MSKKLQIQSSTLRHLAPIGSPIGAGDRAGAQGDAGTVRAPSLPPNCTTPAARWAQIVGLP